MNEAEGSMKTEERQEVIYRSITITWI